MMFSNEDRHLIVHQLNCLKTAFVNPLKEYLNDLNDKRVLKCVKYRQIAQPGKN